MTSKIRVSEPRELLALIPFQLGFTPSESAVLVSLREPRSSVGLVARVDLCDLTDAEFGPELARSLAAHLESDGASGCILVCYVSGVLGPGDPLPPNVLAALENIEHAMTPSLMLDGVWIVDKQNYHVLSQNDMALENGRPLTELQSTAVGAQMVMNGAVVAEGRSSLGPIPVVSTSHTRSAKSAYTEWKFRRQQLRLSADDENCGGRPTVSNVTRSPHHPTSISSWQARGLRLWRLEVERARAAWAEPTRRNRPTTWGRLCAALEDVQVRDAVLLSLVVGEQKLPELTIGSQSHDAEIGAAVAAILDPVAGIPPEPWIVDPSREALTMIVAHSSERSHAPSETLLALISWWEGKGAEASVWLERALRADGGYRLALLMRDAIEGGMPPGWVRARQN